MSVAQRFSSRLPIVLVLLSVCIALDQVIKHWALATLPGRPPQYLLDGFITLVYAENPGVAFSLGSELSDALRFWVFTVGVSFFLLILLVYVLTSPAVRRVELYAYALVLGGGISNVTDRIMHEGIVVDYIVMGKTPLRTAIFNLADTLILVGLGLLLIYSFVAHRSDYASEEIEAADPPPEAAVPPLGVPVSAASEPSGETPSPEDTTSSKDEPVEEQESPADERPSR